MSDASLDKLLANPPLMSKSARELWGALPASPFAKSLQNQTISPSLDLPEVDGWPFLPLSWLRAEPDQLPFACPRFREFRSSGTTASARSHSGFSEDGLLLYKLGALKTFAWVMQQVAPETRQIVSLIPPVASWPDSSLAQMVEWISEFWPVCYSTPQDLRQLPLLDKPIILMGTGFHLIEACDHGAPALVPSGSIIFETGGTKGRTRSVSREEFYQLLCRSFSVADTQIVSEYGMCELASQAYDWYQPGQPRRFQFPGWCQVFVRTIHNTLERTGTGALTLFDPLRLDFPALFSTEDVVTVNESGFLLQGRLTFAPLKGCSLKTESAASAETTAVSSVPAAASFAWSPSSLATEARLSFINVLLAEKSWRALLAEETGSSHDAACLWQGCIRSWQEVQNARGIVQQMSHKENWFIIAPRNHSLAALYPVLLGFLAGYKLTVRVARTTPLLRAICSRLENVEVVDESAVVRAGFSHGYNGVVCYGESHTVRQLTQLAQIPVQGFGSGLAVSFVKAQDVKEFAPELVRDAFAVGQRGCRNVRALLVEGSAANFDRICERLTKAFRAYWQRPFTAEQIGQLSHAMLSLSGHGRPQYREDSDSPLFRQVSVLSSQSLIDAPFSLVIQFVASEADAEAVLRRFLEVNLVLTPYAVRLPGVETLPLGKAHLPDVDGTWQGQRLFDPEIFG